MSKVISLLFLLSFPWLSESQIIQGFKNDFNQGNTEGWKEGGASPNQPEVLSGGGPNGLFDPFLKNESSGQGGPGGKCVMFNQTSGWTGNYLLAGVIVINMHVKNAGPSTLYLRVAFNGMGGVVCSKQSIQVQPDTSWKWISFRLDTFHLLSLTMNGNVNTTLESVNEFRILSSKEPSFTGDQEMHIMDIDNIEASHSPDSLMLNCMIVNHHLPKKLGNVNLEWSGGSKPYQVFIDGPVESAILNLETMSIELDSLVSGEYHILLSDASGKSDTCSFEILLLNGNAPEVSSFDKYYKVYPNPTNGVLIIRALEEESEIHKVQIINSNGEVKQTTYMADQWQTEIQLMGLVSGLYRLIINDKFSLSFSYLN